MEADQRELVKVLLPASEETLWAEPIGKGLYRLANTPFLEPTLNWCDLVRGDGGNVAQIRVSGLVSRGGHSTARILFPPLTHPEARRSALEQLSRSGATYEGAGGGFYVLDLPPTADPAEIRERLEALHAEGILDWEEPGSPSFLARCKEADETNGGIVIHECSTDPNEHADEVVFVDVSSNQLSRETWEQLWVRGAGALREIRNIPFQAYNLALGDLVSVNQQPSEQAVLDRIVRPSGHYTLRVIPESGAARTRVEDLVASLSGLIERESHTQLIAVDAPSAEGARWLSAELTKLEDRGELVFDTGWR